MKLIDRYGNVFEVSDNERLMFLRGRAEWGELTEEEEKELNEREKFGKHSTGIRKELKKAGLM